MNPTFNASNISRSLEEWQLIVVNRKSLNATEVSTGVETTETKVNIFENLRFEESRFKDNKARHDKLHMEFKTIWKYSLLPLWTFDVVRKDYSIGVYQNHLKIKKKY